MQSQPNLKANQTEQTIQELEPPTSPIPTKTTQENTNNELESSPLIRSSPFIITTKLVNSKLITGTMNNHNLIKIEADLEGDIQLNEEEEEDEDNNLPVVQEEEDFNDDENIMLNRINNLNKNIEKYVDTVKCENSINKHEINQKDNNNKSVKIVEMIENNEKNDKKKLDDGEEEEEEKEVESANDCSSSTVETSSGNTTSTNNSSSATTNGEEDDDDDDEVEGDEEANNKTASSNNKTDSFNSTNSELEQS